MHLTAHGLLILFCVLLALGMLLWILLALLMAWSMLRPPRMSAGKAIYHLRRLSPGDLGLGFEEVSFTVRDARGGKKLHIAGWWIPAALPSGKCALLLHGYGDAKVGAIAWAPLLHDLNFNIAAIDLRAHGESGGPFTTGGFFERDDVNQVLDQIIHLFPRQSRQMVLLGVSLGAAVAINVASGRTGISAVILESPIADYEHAIAAQTARLGLPGGLLLRAATAVAQAISGSDFKSVRPVDHLKNLKCPALTIVGADDELLRPADIRQLKEATQSIPNSIFWLIENAGHLQAISVAPMEYERQVRRFLNSILNSREF